MSRLTAFQAALDKLKEEFDLPPEIAIALDEAKLAAEKSDENAVNKLNEILAAKRQARSQ